jgi:CRISPR-associated protein Cmr6
MSTLAGDFFEQASQENWQENKTAFWQVGVIEKWLDRLEANNDLQLWEQIKQLMEIHFKGVMANPDKTKGKKNKPVYKPRVSQIAKRLLAFQ